MSGSWSRRLVPVSRSLSPFNKQPLILPDQVIALLGDELHAQDGRLGTCVLQSVEVHPRHYGALRPAPAS